MFKSQDVYAPEKIERQDFLKLVIECRITQEMKYCLQIIADTFVNSKKVCNKKYIKEQGFYGEEGNIMIRPCKKIYSLLLFETCKLIVKKFYWDEACFNIINCEKTPEIYRKEKNKLNTEDLVFNLSNDYIYKLEVEILYHNGYNFYRNLNFVTFYYILEKKCVSEELFVKILNNKELFSRDCRALYLAVKMLKF